LDYNITHYFAMDGHTCANAKRQQAKTARRHGDERRAMVGGTNRKYGAWGNEESAIPDAYGYATRSRSGGFCGECKQSSPAKIR
jgi:hypothetical protein